MASEASIKRYQLTPATPHLDPFWFRKRSQNEPATVEPDGTLTLDGMKMRFHAEALSPGTAVLVSLARNFFCVSVAEVEAQRAEQDRNAQEHAAKIRADANRRRDEAIRFNGKLTLPFPWKTAIKRVLSGLSERSWGDGRNIRTVVHIMLQQDFEQGRFSRKKGDFLCSSDHGKLGTHWEGSAHLAIDGDGRPYPPKITCTTCLRRACVITGKPIE